MRNVLLFNPDIFKDHRGEYVEIYNKKNYPNIKFVQDDISVSYKNVLRGIHGDNKTWKLVSCLYGKFQLIVVNCNKKSKEFGQWLSFELSDENRYQILIPPTYGNGHLVLSNLAIFHYKQSTYYDRKSQFTYKWYDSQFKIKWLSDNPITSERDK